MDKLDIHERNNAVYSNSEVIKTLYTEFPNLIENIYKNEDEDYNYLVLINSTDGPIVQVDTHTDDYKYASDRTEKLDRRRNVYFITRNMVLGYYNGKTVEEKINHNVDVSLARIDRLAEYYSAPVKNRNTGLISR